MGLFGTANGLFGTANGLLAQQTTCWHSKRFLNIFSEENGS
jgi:hypothetical protein